MIQHRTVLVLGAGASIPFGFPSGFALRELVASTIVRAQLQKLWPEEGEVDRFQAAVARSGQLSVDAFLEHRPEFLEIGKLAIALALIPHENADRLFLRSEPHLYDHVFNALRAPLREFSDNRLTVITFNYDRSLEYYLFQALQNTYNIAGNELDRAMRSVPVLHVYGALGSLAARSYDSRLDAERLNIARAALRVVHERQGASELLAEAHEVLEDAERIAFIGFGYDPINMKRLQLQRLGHTKQIVGSAYGLTEIEKRNVINLSGMGIQLAGRSDDGLMTLRTLMTLDDARAVG